MKAFALKLLTLSASGLVVVAQAQPPSQKNQVRGQVVDEAGKPVPGAAQPPLSPEFVQPAAGFTGMVRDASGKPAAGVLVSFRPWDAEKLFDRCETKPIKMERILCKARPSTAGRCWTRR